MAEPLKNIYTVEYLTNLAKKIKEVYPLFDEKNFLSSLFCDIWSELELKARMRHIAVQLHSSLPLSYQEQLAILKPVSKNLFSFEAMFSLLICFNRIKRNSRYTNTLKNSLHKGQFIWQYALKKL